MSSSTMRIRTRHAGVTLVELIVAIVIIGAAMAGLTAALTRSNRVSVDPLILQQKIAIAENLMGEILLKPYAVNDNPAITRGIRDTYNDIVDYDKYGLVADNPVYGITDVDGAPIAGLDTYSAVVNVDRATPISNVPKGDVMTITITVRHKGDADGDQFVLTGWRTKP